MREDHIGHVRVRAANRTLSLAFGTLLLALAAFLLPELESAPTGGLVGWILFLAGLVELAFGASLGRNAAGRAAIGAGLITTMAGGLFILDPLSGFSPVANIVILWLLLRGSWLLVRAAREQARSRSLS